MGVFWWIPALIPLVGVVIILLCPAWPIARWEGATSSDEIEKNWMKFGIYAVANLLACLLVAWGCWAGAVSKTKFKEVWNYRVVGLKYEMEWTEEVTYTVTVDDGDTTDSDGHVTHHSHTETRHRTDHYGPYWTRIDEYGGGERIDQNEYNRWKKEWKNEVQTGMHEGSSAGFDRSIDGPIFECKWPRTFNTIYPATSVHSYVNKIRVSNSVLKWGKATPQQLAKYPRPVDKGNTGPVILYGGQGVSGEDMLFLRRINADLGFKKEIHAMLVLFDKNADRGVVDDVLTAWAGPNKNELVTFMSVDGTEIRWVEVHSWMDNTMLHATLRDELIGVPFSVHRYGDMLQKFVPPLWQRKHFTPINAYLKISISPGWIWSAVIFAVLFGIASFFLINYVVEDKWSGGRYNQSLYGWRYR
jgi:hypothetical protein